MHFARDVDLNLRPLPLPSHGHYLSLESTWDKRLLFASSRKLKGYTISRLFLREDLPLEARSTKMKRQTGAAPLLSSVSPGPLTKNSPATDDADGTVVCSDAVSGDTTPDAQPSTPNIIISWLLQDIMTPVNLLILNQTLTLLFILGLKASLTLNYGSSLITFL